MTNDEIAQTARKYALQNAVQFNGSAQLKAVIGKVIGTFKKQGHSRDELIPVVESVVKEINDLSLDEQKQMLQRLALGFHDVGLDWGVGSELPVGDNGTGTA